LFSDLLLESAKLFEGREGWEVGPSGLVADFLT